MMLYLQRKFIREATAQRELYANFKTWVSSKFSSGISEGWEGIAT